MTAQPTNDSGDSKPADVGARALDPPAVPADAAAANVAKGISAIASGAAAAMDVRRMAGATFLTMAAVLGSRVIGYFRDAYIAYAFGATRQNDAYVTAFTIPGWLNYLVAGGTLSITFITVFSAFLAQNREREGYRVFSIVANFIAIVLVVGIVLGEIFATPLMRLYVPRFTPDELALCVRMTRILLPAQLFFCLGGVISATLYARGRFAIPAISGLIYNIGIIAGGVAFGHWVGVEGLVFGAVAGAFIGSFVLPLWAARRLGLEYIAAFDFRHPEFIRWLRLTLPLMIGVSLVTADDWVMRPLAAGFAGVIFLLYAAKRLTMVPIAVLGQATGQASMPFYASLAAQGRWQEFRDTVDRSVVNTLVATLLATSWLGALSLPIMRLVYERGLIHDSAARAAALYLFVFVFSLAFWSTQGLYSRAFYAIGNTLTPMVAGTIVFLASIPMYIALAHRFGVVGLAVASDIGIACHTVVLAILLHRRGLLSWNRWRWSKVSRVLLTAAIAGAVLFLLSRRFEGAQYVWWREVVLVAAGSVVWVALVYLLARLLGLEILIEKAMRLVRRVAARAGFQPGEAS
jgi:putative peptidoglycan lipid II flippase